MVASLTNPIAYDLISLTPAGSGAEPMRALLEIRDQVSPEQESNGVGKRFLLVIEVTPESSLITGIYAAPGE
jgi:hypothetical protein